MKAFTHYAEGSKHVSKGSAKLGATDFNRAEACAKLGATDFNRVEGSARLGATSFNCVEASIGWTEASMHCVESSLNRFTAANDLSEAFAKSSAPSLNRAVPSIE
jgi:hypothetical protein